MSETQKSRLPWLPILGIAVIVVGGIAYYLLSRRTPTAPTDAIATAEVVPDEAWMATYISTDEQAWSQLSKFGTPEAQTVIRDSLDQFKQNTFPQGSIDFDEDLKPWIGNVMVAMLPGTAASEGEGSTEPSPLLVVDIKDKAKALEFANRMKQEQGDKISESDYQGVTITEFQGEKSPTYMATLGTERLVLAPQRQSVEQSIDTFKGEPSFASDTEAQALLAKGANVKNPLAQVYFTDYAAVVKQMRANAPEGQMPPVTEEQLAAVQSVVMGVGVDDLGLRFRAVAQFNPQPNQPEFKPAPGKVISQFPTETFLLITGRGISESWSRVVTQAEDNPQLQQALQQVRQPIQQLGLDADTEVFGWMDGEFALGAIASQEGLLGQFGFGGAIILETSDRETAQGTLDKLGNFAQQNPSISLGDREVEGTSLKDWNVSTLGTILSHGWLDDNSLLIALGGPLADTMVTQPETSLNNSDSFKTITGTLPQTNQGYFYLDMNQAMDVIGSLPQAPTNQMPPETKAVLDSIRGIGVTATMEGKEKGMLEMLFALTPSEG